MDLCQVFGEKWKTSKVTTMDSMFQCLDDLVSLDLSTWDISSARDISYVFYNCSSLALLNLSNAIFTQVTTYNYMFEGANSSITVTVKDQDAYDFITARLSEYNGGNVVIA